MYWAAVPSSPCDETGDPLPGCRADRRSGSSNARQADCSIFQRPAARGWRARSRPEMSHTTLTVPGMNEPPSRYDVTVRLAKDDGRQLMPDYRSRLHQAVLHVHPGSLRLEVRGECGCACQACVAVGRTRSSLTSTSAGCSMAYLTACPMASGSVPMAVGLHLLSGGLAAGGADDRSVVPVPASEARVSDPEVGHDLIPLGNDKPGPGGGQAREVSDDRCGRRREHRCPVGEAVAGQRAFAVDVPDHAARRRGQAARRAAARRPRLASR